MDDINKEYEIAYLLKEEAGESELKEMIQAYSGAEISFSSPLTRLNLSYAIKKESMAYFGYAYFNFPPSEMNGLSRALELRPGILRFLIITPPIVKSKPRPAQSYKPKSRPAPEARREEPSAPLSNEALEKKIEEILNK